MMKIKNVISDDDDDDDDDDDCDDDCDDDDDPSPPQQQGQWKFSALPFFRDKSADKYFL